MSKRSWLNVSTSLFSLLWGLTASGLTACRDNVGSCSTDTTTLCLQIDLESRAQVPHFLNVSVGSTRQATLQKELDAAPLATRPYMLEIKPTVDSTVSLTIDVQGVDHDPATGSSVPVATSMANGPHTVPVLNSVAMLVFVWSPMNAPTFSSPVSTFCPAIVISTLE